MVGYSGDGDVAVLMVVILSSRLLGRDKGEEEEDGPKVGFPTGRSLLANGLEWRWL